jgi:hypothetical protein
MRRETIVATLALDRAIELAQAAVHLAPLLPQAHAQFGHVLQAPASRPNCASRFRRRRYQVESRGLPLARF